jgi:hypothetical protein
MADPIEFDAIANKRRPTRVGSAAVGAALFVTGDLK